MVGNRTLYSLTTLLTSKLLKRQSKEGSNRREVTYGSETWTLNQWELNKHLVLKRKMVFELQKDETAGRHNVELRHYISPCL